MSYLTFAVLGIAAILIWQKTFSCERGYHDWWPWLNRKQGTNWFQERTCADCAKSEQRIVGTWLKRDGEADSQ